MRDLSGILGVMLACLMFHNRKDLTMKRYLLALAALALCSIPAHACNFSFSAFNACHAVQVQSFAVVQSFVPVATVAFVPQVSYAPVAVQAQAIQANVYAQPMAAAAVVQQAAVVNAYPAAVNVNVRAVARQRVGIIKRLRSRQVVKTRTVIR